METISVSDQIMIDRDPSKSLYDGWAVKVEE
jgi:hypothetical protein